jgi:hypothetical protein
MWVYANRPRVGVSNELAAQSPARNRAPGPVVRANQPHRLAAITDGPSAASGAPLQRKLYWFPPQSKGTFQDLDSMAATLDGQTEAAKVRVTKLLAKGLENKDDVPEISVDRFYSWQKALAGKNDALKAAATGYIVEDIVTDWAKTDTRYTAQHRISGAILDFRLEDSKKNVGLLDITSEGQKGHILNKAFPAANYGHKVESVYENFNFSGTPQPKLDAKAAAEIAVIIRTHANARLGKHIEELRTDAELRQPVGSKELRGQAEIVRVAAGKLRTIEARTSDNINELEKLVQDYNNAAKKEGHQDQQLVSIRQRVEEIKARYGQTTEPPWSEEPLSTDYTEAAGAWNYVPSLRTAVLGLVALGAVVFRAQLRGMLESYFGL